MGVRVSTDEEIYLKHRDGLMRYATALVGPDGAPDVVSTVVTKLLGSGKTLMDLRGAAGVSNASGIERVVAISRQALAEPTNRVRRAAP